MSGNMCEEVLMLINMFHKLPNRKYFLVSIMIIKAHFIYVPFLAYAEHHNFYLGDSGHQVKQIWFPFQFTDNCIFFSFAAK